MFVDQIKLTGDLSIVRFNEQGEETFRQEINNLVVTTGKNWVASRMVGTSAALISYMAIGAPSTTVAPVVTDTTLATEIARVALTTAGGTASNNVVTFQATFPAGTGTSGNISEAGLFNASTNGTMLCRTTFSPISKLSTDSIAISWNVTVN